jgi:hypothetical protein
MCGGLYNTYRQRKVGDTYNERFEGTVGYCMTHITKGWRVGYCMILAYITKDVGVAFCMTCMSIEVCG